MSTDKINILVVDDLPEKRLVLETVLEELGQNVVCARSGEEALRQILDNEFAVILLDVNMPGLDGLETAALIRRRKKSAHTPIIFVTAFADEMHTAQGYSLGAVDYILSPVVPEVLRTKVKVFVDLFRMTQQVKQQADERVALAQEQAARAAAEEANRRSAFLADASKVLASSLQTEATLHELLRLAVPYLGDLSAITLVDEQGHTVLTELAWIDSAGQHFLAQAALGSLDPTLGEAIRRVLAIGTTEHLSEIRQELLAPGSRALPGNGTSDDPCPPADLRSAVVIPLVARGRVLGALSLAMGHSGRSYHSPDLALAEDLASRAAIAIDNARLYKDIQQADRHKNEFLSMLAHELRNPLAPIRNAVHILKLRGSDQPELQEVRDMIERQVQQLVRLVDDLLDISRITRGKIRLQTESVDLAKVVSRAVETSRPLIDARKHELTITLDSQALCVKGDPVRLAQVLGNLLNNAAKYTEEGGQIWLTAERDGNEAVLRVRDSGIGIPAPMLSAVFDLFTQVEHSLHRSQGGLGIGLTLVRRLVEMHGGQVQAFSAGTNQGSEFVVRLPAHPKELLPPPVGNEIACPPPGSCHVLIVDDNVDAADSLALLLRMKGHEVRVCHDGPAGLEAAGRFDPEIVLLDIGLPGMDGYEVARRLRARPGSSQMLLVALTGYGQEEDQRRSREAGFDHHLIKPAEPAALTALFAGLRPRTRIKLAAEH